MSKVYIGVGHGGSDAGAVKYLVEKDINLKMARACRDLLAANGVETKMSRETDKTMTVTQKTNEANEWGADLALDIHNNAGGGDGAEVFHSISFGTGKTLADNILAEVQKIGQNSRGAKTKKGSNGDYFGFIRQTNMPAVITEMIFVDNAADASQADTDEECKAFGEAIAKGVLKTLGISIKTPYAPTPSPSTDSEQVMFIKAVQSACGAKVDGISGNETISKTVTLSRRCNTRHAVVKAVQSYLNYLGYDCGSVDGIFGAKTAAAVTRYQKANGCVCDGIITARNKTWKKLLGMAA